MGYRKLTEGEIAKLEANGCSSEEWSRVEVAEGFLPDRVKAAVFSGDCRLGAFRADFVQPGGVKKPSGIYRASLHNTTVGDDVRISNVNSYIANYDIGAKSHIGNVDKIYVDGEATFGNGVEVAVLNEVGGREVTIHTKLSAHEAYIEAMYRHRPGLVARLKAFARDEAEKAKSTRGRIVQILPSAMSHEYNVGSMWLDAIRDHRAAIIARGNSEVEFSRAACLEVNEAAKMMATQALPSGHSPALSGKAIYWLPEGPKVMS